MKVAPTRAETATKAEERQRAGLRHYPRTARVDVVDKHALIDRHLFVLIATDPKVRIIYVVADQRLIAIGNAVPVAFLGTI